MISTLWRDGTASIRPPRYRRQQFASLARNSLRTWVGLLVVTVAACGDDVMGPTTEPYSSMASFHSGGSECDFLGAILVEGGCVISVEGLSIIAGGSSFDPWCSRGWERNEIGACEPEWGGWPDSSDEPDWDDWDDGGGGDGGSSGAEDVFTDGEWEENCRPEITPGCVLRHPQDWTEAEKVAVDEAVQDIYEHGCEAEGNILTAHLRAGRLGLWNLRYAPFGLLTYGRTDPVTRKVYLWTGYNAEPGDDVNWSRTLAHEANHVLHPEWRHSQIFAAAELCH